MWNYEPHLPIPPKSSNFPKNFPRMRWSPSNNTAAYTTPISFTGVNYTSLHPRKPPFPSGLLRTQAAEHKIQQPRGYSN